MDLTFAKTSITSALARRMLDAAEGEAAKIRRPVAVAVVDDSGVLKAFTQMDGAPLISVQVAQDKAYTAAASKRATGDWYDVIKDDPPLAAGAIQGIDRLIVFGGGFPIEVDGNVIGGIGVSGGHYSQDVEVAQAALEALQTITD